MRASFKIKLIDDCNNEIIIPATYRKNFLALIKKALNNIEELKSFVNSNFQKPFTFCVNFTAKKSERKGFLNLKKNELEFCFSTNDYTVLSAIYNFIVKNINEYPIFPNKKNLLISTPILKNKKIDSDEILFKTISPILVRDVKNGNKTLQYFETDFIYSLKLSIKSVIKKFLRDNVMLDELDIELGEMKSDTIMSFGNQQKNSFGVYGNKGIIKIRAKPSYLQLLYDIGIGAKRSQGFGMVEVIKEHKQI